MDQTTRRLGGTGLGLAVARQLAQLLAGEVTFQPGREGGSVFTVRLPLRPAERLEAVPQDPAEVSPTEQRTRGRRSVTRRGSRRG